MYPNIVTVLEAALAPEVRVAYLRFGKGSGKTFFSATCMAWAIGNLSDMRCPQLRYGLTPDALISVANLSTAKEQAHKAVFHELRSIVKRSHWLRSRLEGVGLYEHTLRFKNNIMARCGHSKGATQEGMNLILGVLDEACRLRDDQGRVHAEELVNLMKSSAETRFPDYKIIVVSSPERDGDYLGRSLDFFRKHGEKIDLQLDLRGYDL